MTFTTLSHYLFLLAFKALNRLPKIGLFGMWCFLKNSSQSSLCLG